MSSSRNLIYRVKGSRKTQNKIRQLLKQPEFYSGMLPKGNFNINLTPLEALKLKNNGIKITLDRRFSDD